MPVYNGARYLEEAIESILNQTFSDFEFIIIDDGSTDNSLKIIKQYAGIDSRIQIITRENKGLVLTLNEGISLARGEFIARMDADDVSLPNRFEKQIELLTTKGADICGCHYHLIDEKGVYIDSAITPLCLNSFAVYLSSTTPFAHGSVMVRREVFQGRKYYYGMTGAKSAEDYALWIEMFNHGMKFANVDEFLFKYRDFSGSLSKGNKVAVKQDAKRLSRDFILQNKDMLFLRVNQLDDLRISNREQELLVIALFRMSVMLRKISVMSALRKFSRRNLVVGFVRFVFGVS